MKPKSHSLQKHHDEVIKIQDVYKIYKMGDEEVHALDGINLILKRHEIVSIIGPSGSGKTTLLDVLSCMLRPTRGEVYINGKAISQMNDGTLAQVRAKTIGFIFQTFNLIPKLTAAENVMLPMWFQGVAVQERLPKAIAALESVGLGNRLHHKPGELSGGQRQRVAIARALATNPDVIVADEPTGNLDSESGKQVLKILQQLHEEKGKTIIVVTHDPDISKLADRIVHIKDGKIEEIEEDHQKLSIEEITSRRIKK